MKSKSSVATIQWYVEHRLEYLRNRQSSIKTQLEQKTPAFQYDALKEFMENRGRIEELENILRHSESW